jgi:hypothetical protein
MSYKSITDFIKPTIITAQQYGTKVSVEIDHSDTDIDELFDAFQTLVVGLGYHESAWKSWILDRADEYRETDAEDLKKKLTEWQDDEVTDVVFHNDVKFTDEEIDKALAQHNAHEEGFDVDESEYDDYGQLIEPNEALKAAAKKYKKLVNKTKKK